MGLRFRKSFKLFPGVRLNVSKSGVSASFGGPGATLNVGPRGVRGTAGLLGTGLSFSTTLVPAATIPSTNQPSPTPPGMWSPPSVPSSPPPRGQPQPYQHLPDPSMSIIASGPVDQLSSASLEQFRQMVIAARQQQREAQAGFQEATNHAKQLAAERRWKSWFIFRWLFGKRLVEIEGEIASCNADAVFFREWIEATRLEVDFHLAPDALQAYGMLVSSYEQLRQSSTAWDVTADRATKRVVERTTANRVIDRRSIRLDYSQSELIRFQGKALRLPNSINEDLLIYPGLILMERADGVFALIDIRDVALQHGSVNFIEEQPVPPDSVVVGHTWAKANKDGSPDRRFSSNYQIPICQYGLLRFASRSGLCEEYQFSNAHAAVNFGSAFDRLKSAIQRS